MMRLLICLGMLFALTSTGCVPVLIGGAIYAGAKKHDARQEFLANFHATNTEREKNGLEPLDLCSEQYRFDRSWAMKDPECRERIRAYEKGDKTALTPSSAGGTPANRSSAQQNCRSLVCDVRIVRVSDGSVVVTASGKASRDKLMDLARALADKLVEGVMVKGESLAVVSLCNRVGSDCGKQCADELADKLTAALVDTDWFSVKERIELRSIIQEQDLEAADIVKHAKAREKMGSVKYIVIGGVTVEQSANG